MKAMRLERIDDLRFIRLDGQELVQMVGGQTTSIPTGPVTDPLPHRPGDHADTSTD